MKYVTCYYSILNGLSDIDVHEDKDSAIRFYRKEAHRYFDGLRLPDKTKVPTACGFAHRMYMLMSIRKFHSEFPEEKGGAK